MSAVKILDVRVGVKIQNTDKRDIEWLTTEIEAEFDAFARIMRRRYSGVTVELNRRRP